MPTITDLRNPALKTRHWDQIETILSHRFSDDQQLDLGLLVELEAFNFIEEIQEVSSQASSEASLEVLLKKVCCRFYRIYKGNDLRKILSNAKSQILRFFIFEPTDFNFI